MMVYIRSTGHVQKFKKNPKILKSYFGPGSPKNKFSGFSGIFYEKNPEIWKSWPETLESRVRRPGNLQYSVQYTVQYTVHYTVQCILYIVLSRNGISVEINICRFDQKNQLAENSLCSWSDHDSKEVNTHVLKNEKCTVAKHRTSALSFRNCSISFE